MKLEVIGVTTDKKSIAKMLGVKEENEYGFYQETAKGKYYSKILDDGKLDEKLVCLLNPQSAANAEISSCANIKNACTGIKNIIAETPKINAELKIRPVDVEPIQVAGKRIKNIIKETESIHI